MQDIKDIPLSKLPDTIKAFGLKPFTTSQLIQWLYKKGATSFDEMTNLSMDARRVLSENFHTGRLRLKNTLASIDGTKKFAWELEDGNIVESVLIPSEPGSKVPNPPTPPFKKGGQTAMSPPLEKGGPGGISTRLTLCVSTQVGCAMGCSFCRTAGMGFVRDLTQGEIVGQILEASSVIASLPRSAGRAKQSPANKCVRGIASSPKAPRNDTPRITNVVLMGMGEPLANYENVLSAIRIMTDTKCLNLSRRHVTLSTCGLIPGIEKLAKDDPGVKLAISLNATTDEQREKIMPVNKKYPLAKLFEALKKYSAATKRSRMTFEYVMIDGFNDSNEDAKRLVKFLSYFPSKVNLIPLNPVTQRSGRACSAQDVAQDFSPASSIGRSKDLRYKAPSESTIQRFAQFLRNKHIQVNIRSSRGQDILAACGQLASGK